MAVSELRDRSAHGSPVEPRTFFLEGCEGKCFVELPRLIVLFHVRLTQFFVGVALSEFPFVGLLHVLPERCDREAAALSSRD
jgi:hypothetical protein